MCRSRTLPWVKPRLSAPAVEELKLAEAQAEIVCRERLANELPAARQIGVDGCSTSATPNIGMSGGERPPTSSSRAARQWSKTVPSPRSEMSRCDACALCERAAILVVMDLENHLHEEIGCVPVTRPPS